MKQYEIRWANLPAPIGRRAVLLLTRTAGYSYLNKVIVAEVTSTIRGIPEEVRVGTREGLKRPSVVNLDNVHVVPKSLVGDRISELSSSREREVKRALGYALDWPELKVLWLSARERVRLIARGLASGTRATPLSTRHAPRLVRWDRSPDEYVSQAACRAPRPTDRTS